MGASLPLPVLLGVIAVGIPVLLALIHAGGGSKGQELDEDAVRRLLDTQTDDPAVDLLLADDRSAALVRTVTGRCFVAWTMESRQAIREVEPCAVRLGEQRLVVHLGDPGWPDRTLPVGDARLRDAWAGEGHAT